MFAETGAKAIAENVLEFVTREDYRKQPIIVHCFSAGWHVFMELVDIARQADLYNHDGVSEDAISSRVKGQIF